MSMLCVNCGKEIDPTGNFCSYCGATINPTATPSFGDSANAPPLSQNNTKPQKGTNWYRIGFLVSLVVVIGALAAHIIPLLAGSKPSSKGLGGLAIWFGIAVACWNKNKGKSGLAGFGIGVLLATVFVFSLHAVYGFTHRKRAKVYTSSYSVNSQPLPLSFKGDVFTINYPDNWQIVSSGSPNTLIQINSENGAGDEACTVTSKPMPDEMKKYQNNQYVNAFTEEELVKKYQSEIPGIIADNSGKLQLGDREAFRCDFTANQDGTLTKLTQMFLSNNGQFYYINCRSSAAKYSKYREQIERILASVKFSK